jgi:serine protease Do
MKTNLTKFSVIFLSIVLVVSLGIFGCSPAVQQTPAQVPTSPAAPAQINPPKQLSGNRNTFVVQAVKQVSPSVVGITNKIYVRDNYNQQVLIGKGVGSGVIIDSKGYIATNNHVIEGSQEISVSLADGKVVNGKVVGADPVTDLAVVKVETTGLPAVGFGDSDSLMVGEPAIAIGNPLGLEFQGSVTAGVISALNRTIEVGDRRFKLIQTDAAINPGNSGGALINADGQVVGINSVKVAAAGVEGIGFAIPINSARPIIQTLIEKGKIIRAYLGVSLLDKSTAERNGFLVQFDKGILVARVEKNGPADRAGIQEGDIIVKINTSDVNSVADLRAILDNIPIDTKLSIVILRDDQTLTVAPVVTEAPN